MGVFPWKRQGIGCRFRGSTSGKRLLPWPAQRSALMEPRMLVIARQACSVTSAQAPEDHPHSAHSTLLSIRIQKPTLRRCAEREPTHHAPRMEARKARSEEHTSELQSPCNLVCRLL